TRFAAQYLARGLPCERFTAALASRTSCITRGRGGWLDLPRGGLSPPILCQLPGALGIGSKRDEKSCPLSRQLSRKAAMAAASAQRLAATLLILPIHARNALGKPASSTMAQNLDTW